MNQKTKAGIELAIVAVLIVLGGAFGGLWLANNYESIPPIYLAIVAVALLAFAGLGKGIYSLSTTLGYDCPKLFAYLPFTQDIVVHTVVKTMNNPSSFRKAITKINLLLISTIMLVVAGASVVINNMLTHRMLVEAQGDVEVVQKVLNIHSLLLTGIGAVAIFAIIIRTIYFEYIFKTVYRNPIICALGLILPIQIILVAILHNQLGYMLTQHNRSTNQSNRGGQIQQPSQAQRQANQMNQRRIQPASAQPRPQGQPQGQRLVKQPQGQIQGQRPMGQPQGQRPMPQQRPQQRPPQRQMPPR